MTFHSQGLKLFLRKFSRNDHRDRKAVKPPVQNSVRDFDTSSTTGTLEAELRGKIQSREQSDRDGSSRTLRSQSSSRSKSVQWKLTNFDALNSMPQTMEEELKRLQALQGYFILDSRKQAEFEEFTKLACKVFDAPISFISFVDLGRQWFLSKIGFDFTELPRKDAFCAHVVINKNRIIVVPDALQDDRFKNNPAVRGFPYARFYASAALISPEGFKLGTICVMDTKPRTYGLKLQEQEILNHMAQLVVNALVARRDRMIKLQYHDRMKRTCATLMESSNFSTEAKRDLEQLVKENADSKVACPLKVLGEKMEVHSKSVHAAIRNIVYDLEPNSEEISSTVESKCNPTCTLMNDIDAVEARLCNILYPQTDPRQLFQSINKIISASFCRTHPITIELDNTVPCKLAVEDLLLFRASLSLITHAVKRLEHSENEQGSIQFKICCIEKDLFVECRYSSCDEKEKSGAPFLPSLVPAASFVYPMGGMCGDSEGRCWFRVPLDPIVTADGLIDISEIETIGETLQLVHGVRKPPSGSPATGTDTSNVQKVLKDTILKLETCLPTA